MYFILASCLLLDIIRAFSCTWIWVLCVNYRSPYRWSYGVAYCSSVLHSSRGLFKAQRYYNGALHHISEFIMQWTSCLYLSLFMGRYTGCWLTGSLLGWRPPASRIRIQIPNLYMKSLPAGKQQWNKWWGPVRFIGWALHWMHLQPSAVLVS